MLDKKNLFELAKVVANANPTSQVAYSYGDNKFSYSELNETLRKELNEYAGSYALYRENKNTIFALIENAIDEVLPAKVLKEYGMFADIKQFKQGDKPVFTERITQHSKRRAKKFITKVGLAGVYEVFKLDGASYEIPTTAFGGAAEIGLEEFLDGRVDFADLLDVVMEGLDESLYREIQKALVGVVADIQDANKTTQTQFDEAAMDKLLAVADAYGPSAIYCTYEFAATMVPAEGWRSNEQKNEKWNNGYIAYYKGHNVIVLPQSFEDETNTLKTIDPAYAWIIPVGNGSHPIKIALEGQTIVDEYQNRDRSREVQVYKKMGVGAIIQNNLCVYINSSLTRD